jgi:hypothetical protein
MYKISRPDERTTKRHRAEVVEEEGAVSVSEMKSALDDANVDSNVTELAPIAEEIDEADRELVNSESFTELQSAIDHVQVFAKSHRGCEELIRAAKEQYDRERNTGRAMATMKGSVVAADVDLWSQLEIEAEVIEPAEGAVSVSAPEESKSVEVEADVTEPAEGALSVSEPKTSPIPRPRPRPQPWVPDLSRGGFAMSYQTPAEIMETLQAMADNRQEDSEEARRREEYHQRKEAEVDAWLATRDTEQERKEAESSLFRVTCVDIDPLPSDFGQSEPEVKAEPQTDTADVDDESDGDADDAPQISKFQGHR